MAHLQYSSYPGIGEQKSKAYGYSQAVRVGDRIECSGQGTPTASNNAIFPLTLLAGGWDPKTGEYSTAVETQIQNAFANVDLCLKDAGGKGWTQVFTIASYHVPLNNEVLALMSR